MSILGHLPTTDDSGLILRRRARARADCLQRASGGGGRGHRCGARDSMLQVCHHRNITFLHVPRRHGCGLTKPRCQRVVRGCDAGPSAPTRALAADLGHVQQVFEPKLARLARQYLLKAFGRHAMLQLNQLLARCDLDIHPVERALQAHFPDAEHPHFRRAARQRGLFVAFQPQLALNALHLREQAEEDEVDVGKSLGYVIDGSPEVMLSARAGISEGPHLLPLADQLLDAFNQLLLLPNNHRGIRERYDKNPPDR
eukprot:3799298-Prymnesium_polylepis.2